MKIPKTVARLLALSAIVAGATNPFGLFDFNLRGKDPAARIRSLDGIGSDGITMPLRTPKDLEKLEAYQKAKPDLRMFAGLCHIDDSNPVSHYQNSYNNDQKMRREVDAEN